jgi:hypothetical protein
MNITKKAVTFVLVGASFLIGTVPDSHAEGKDRGKAFFLSFLVPGLGQYYAGAPGSAKLFAAAELAIWGGYYYNSLMKRSCRDDYFLQAGLHAGATPSGRGLLYLNAVGAYNSSFEFNAYQFQMKEEPVLFTGRAEWKWDSEVERIKFRSLRESELNYENTIKYCIAGAVLNHLLAGLHAANVVMRNHADGGLTVVPAGRGLKAVYTRSF